MHSASDTQFNQVCRLQESEGLHERPQAGLSGSQQRGGRKRPESSGRQVGRGLSNCHQELEGQLGTPQRILPIYRTYPQDNLYDGHRGGVSQATS